MAVVLSKIFMRSISQNPNENQTGVSLWTLEDVEKAQAKAKQQLLTAESSLPNNVNINEDEYGDGGISDYLLEEMELDQ